MSIGCGESFIMHIIIIQVIFIATYLMCMCKVDFHAQVRTAMTLPVLAYIQLVMEGLGPEYIQSHAYI